MYVCTYRIGSVGAAGCPVKTAATRRDARETGKSKNLNHLDPAAAVYSLNLESESFHLFVYASRVISRLKVYVERRIAAPRRSILQLKLKMAIFWMSRIKRRRILHAQSIIAAEIVYFKT